MSAPEAFKVEHGGRYRAVVQVPVPRFLVPDAALRDRVAAEHFTDARIWTTEDDLPADWPRTARYTDGPDGWYAYVEGTWDGPTGFVDKPPQLMTVWRIDAAPGSPPKPVPPPDPDPPASPPVLPLPPPVVPGDPPAPPKAAGPSSSWLAVVVGCFAGAAVIVGAVVAADAWGEDE